MNALERIINKALNERWHLKLQRTSEGFDILQAQYKVRDETWFRTYVFYPDNSEKGISVATNVFNYVEQNGLHAYKRHYVLVRPRNTLHKTFFITSGGEPPQPPPPPPQQREEQLPGVYLPPPR